MITVGTLHSTVAEGEASIRTILAAAVLADVKLDTSNALPAWKMSKVPSITGIVFVAADRETFLTEPNAIAYLLSERASNEQTTLQLVGETPERRLHILQWLFWNQARFEPAVKRLASLASQPRGPEQKAAVQELVTLVEYLESELRDENWQGRASILEIWNNDQDVGPNLADVALAITLHDAFAVAFNEETREDYGSCFKLYTKVRETPGLAPFFSGSETGNGAEDES